MRFAIGSHAAVSVLELGELGLATDKDRWLAAHPRGRMSDSA